MNMRATLVVVVLLLLFGAVHPLTAHTADPVPQAPAANEEPDIQWFREQLEIAPRYQQHEEGVLGMSWSHFLIMLFLILFFFSALLMHYHKVRRTKQLIDALLKEEHHGSNS